MTRKEYIMTDTNREALTRAVSVLREVTQKLIQGMNKTAFEQEYRGKYVSPGVTVQQYVRQLRLAGDLSETDTTIKLKSNTAVAA
jgi:hypothetical protein